MYGAGLEDKPEIVALNKIDTLDPAALKRRRSLSRAISKPVHLVSAASGEGLEPLDKLIECRPLGGRAGGETNGRR